MADQLNLRDWLDEHQQNAEHLAHLRPAERSGWLEDANYFRRAVDAVDELERRRRAPSASHPAAPLVSEPAVQPAMPSEGALHPLRDDPLQLLVDEIGVMRRALDAIYNHNEAARAAVIQHYGVSHQDISMVVQALRARGVAVQPEQPQSQQPDSFHQTSASGVCDVQTALRDALVACLPFIDDAADIAPYYPDSSATEACRAAVAMAKKALECHKAG